MDLLKMMDIYDKHPISSAGYTPHLGIYFVEGVRFRIALIDPASKKDFIWNNQISLERIELTIHPERLFERFLEQAHSEFRGFLKGL